MQDNNNLSRFHNNVVTLNQHHTFFLSLSLLENIITKEYFLFIVILPLLYF